VDGALTNAALYRESQEASRVREDFLSVASHELRNPLNALSLNIQAFRRSVERGSAAGLSIPRVLERLRTVERQTQRMSRLIHNLLDISRITAGRVQLEPEVMDLSALMREVAARFEDELDRAGCPFTLCADEPILGKWDRLRLDQIATNLLGNAVKYAPGKPIELTAGAEGETVWFRVRDQGIGIARSEQERIFQRFERAVSARQPGGFGLGLWIVRSLVQMMGGTIRVESAPGQGAAFTVELPRGAVYEPQEERCAASG
jgi:signal transduction histidine kinase